MTYNIFDWPVKEHTVCLYAQFLAYIFHSAKSVHNYIAGVRKMHMLSRVVPPSLTDIEIQITFLGLNKTLISPIKQAQPLMPDIMLDMATFLDFSTRANLVFWGVIVVGFFTFFRKSNLLPDTKDSFDFDRQLSRADVSFKNNVAVLTIGWSKTIQYRQKCVQVPMFQIPGSVMCPVTTLKASLSLPSKKKA